MFTIEQIKSAHAQVKSGADFPAYIQVIITLGVTRYTTYVSDGLTNFAGKNGYQVQWPSKYDAMEINNSPNAEQFIRDLKSHQQGGSDYLTFCRQCATNGVEKWIVRLDEMTCTYYNRQGQAMLVEKIPVPKDGYDL